MSAPPPPTPAPTRPAAEPAHATVEFDQFVDQRIEKTRRGVVAADLATAGGTLLAGMLALLLVAALLEHWVVAGGLGPNERVAFWAVGLIGAVAYAVRHVWPPLTRSINPLYAADELERDSPELKNSLLNLLQLRDETSLPSTVRDTLERQAAERLAGTRDQGVDLAPLVRIGYVLLTLVAIVGLYVVFSPKDFFTTAQRIVLPWSEVAPPSRVQIEDLMPGDATLRQGERVRISARIVGLDASERPELVYSSDDGQSIDRRVPLTQDASTSRYSTTLPDKTSPLGLQADLRYRIEAGDARTRFYTIEVRATPTIAPHSIHYDYPDYTGYLDRTTTGEGDILAIEGTRLTLSAEANQPIESAQVDLGADGRPDLRMRIDALRATTEWTLRRREPSNAAREASSYTLRYTTLSGEANLDPPRYQITIVADLPPEAKLQAPQEPIVTVRAEQPVRIEIEGRDPDFALSHVRLVGEVNGKRILETPLYVAPRGDPGHRGQFEATYRLVPARLGLRGGETIDYWAEVLDNRLPEPNRGRSVEQKIRVLPEEPGDPNRGEPGDEQNPSAPEPPAGEQGDPNDGGEPSDDRNEQGPNEQGSERSDPSDTPQTDPNESKQNEAEQGEGEQSEGDSGGLQGEGEENANAESSDSQAGGAAGKNSNNSEQQNGSSGNDPSEESPSPGESSQDSQPGEGGSQQRRPGEPTGGEQRSVAKDGSDDGTAFEKIRKHLDEQQQSEGETGEQPTSDQRTEGRDTTSETEQGDPTVDATEPPEGAASSGEEEGASPSANPQTGEQPDPSAGPEPEGGGEQPTEEEQRGGEASDSQSSESGGEATPGEQNQSSDSPHEGIGSAGENQAADDGSGQSADQGPGNTTGRSGDQQPGERPSESDPSHGHTTDDKQGKHSPSGRSADEPSDEAGNEQGNRPNEGGSGNSPSSESTDQETPPGDPNSEANRAGDPRGPNRGGDRDRDNLDRPEVDAPEPGGDAANLDYARRQTDLVLDRLSDQLAKRDVDRELLDKLGWSEDDLRRFVARWQERKQNALTDPNQGQSELDSALRSLGLDNRQLSTETTAGEDRLRDLQQGHRGTIPPALHDRLERYQRGVTAGDDP